MPESYAPEFDVPDVLELLGQLVGYCSVTRFWDEMPDNYPSGCGVFLDKEATRIVQAAYNAYLNVTIDEAREEGLA